MPADYEGLSGERALAVLPRLVVQQALYHGSKEIKYQIQRSGTSPEGRIYFELGFYDLTTVLEGHAEEGQIVEARATSQQRSGNNVQCVALLSLQGFEISSSMTEVYKPNAYI